MASPVAMAETVEERSAKPAAAVAPAVNGMQGPIEIELPALGEAPTELGTSQNGLEILQATEVKAEWESPDEAARKKVYSKDVSNVYVGKQEIERYRGATVSDLFKGLNGVYTGDARNSGALDPNIRGIQGEGRVPLTIDGTEQATSVWQGSAGVSNRNYIDPNMVGSISVEKGPSMTAGIKSGIGGSVEVKTLDVDDIVKPGESFGLEIKTETATNAVKPNERGMSNFGKDYRDIDGAYATGFGQVNFTKGGGIGYTPHASARDTNFDFEDNAFRIAAATRQENFDLFAAYSYRDKGNYFSGKGGSHRYETQDWLVKARSDEYKNLGGTTSSNYVGNIFLPGHEVSNTSNEMRTTLLKGTLYLPNDQSLKLSYMHSDLTFGESVPYMISETIRLSPTTVNFGLQFPYSEVKQDTVALNYKWAPEGSQWIDVQAGVWMTQSDSRRHQNGDDIYGIDIRSYAQQDRNWDLYVQCQAEPKLSNCVGAPTTPPDRLPNTDGRFTVVERALQVTNHDRWGVNLSNRIILTDSLTLNLSGDFSSEKLKQKDASRDGDPFLYSWATRHMGPRTGEREQYNFSFNNEWAATPWLTVNLGARYSDYNSFDSGLADARASRRAGWGASSAMIAEEFTYHQLLTDEENQAFVDNARGFVESWGLSPEETEEELAWWLESGKINGLRYKEQKAVVPSEGFRLSRAENPFLNGTIDLSEQVSNPHGTTGLVNRYVVDNRVVTGSPIYAPDLTEAERWAKPDKKKDSAWAPMAGITLKVTDFARIYGRYTEFVRFPSIYEDTQAAYGGGTGRVSSNAMRPEHAYNWEVGFVHDLRGFLPSWRSADWRINYYKNTIRDFVDRDFTYAIVQYDKKIYSGIELQSRFDTGRYFSSMGISYRIDQKLCDKDTASTYDPFYGKKMDECVTAGFPTTFSRTSLQPQYSIDLDGGMRLFDEQLELGGRMVYHSSAKNKMEAKWIEQGMWFVEGMNVPYEWHPVWVFDAYATVHVNEHVDVDFGVNNITNRYYLDPLARAMMPAPGRTLKMGLTARF